MTADQIEPVRKWLGKNLDHKNAGRVCESLIECGYVEGNRDIIYNWCDKHIIEENTGEVLWKLVANTKTAESIATAKRWLENRAEGNLRNSVIGALLGARDGETIRAVKDLLKSGFSRDHVGFAQCLLDGCPDEETFSIYRQFLRCLHESRPEPYFWIQSPQNMSQTQDTTGGTVSHRRRIDITLPVMLMNLLYLDSSGESSNLAYRLPELWIGSPLEPSILSNLHKNERNKQRTISETRRWLSENPCHEYSDYLAKVLENDSDDASSSA